ncbi:MAG TPA: dethiobiotin synthase [Gemmatimonadales bacterium]|nr:dethiobiotin synthase [Gemmatimonadales bacterium]
MIRLGITGTDTGVGKTVVGVALLAMLRQRGLRPAPMKPVETGVTERGPADALLLASAAGSSHSLEDVNPFQYPDPLAPLVAAERAGRPVEVSALDAAFARITREADAVVVEGAGGLLVPIAPRLSYADLFLRWGLDLVIVAANRLGAINHILLTLEAATSAGIRVRAVVLNAITPAPDLATATNPDAIRTLAPGVPLLLFPWTEHARDVEQLGALARASGLDTLFLPYGD